MDASIALAWCFADEATPTTIALLEKLETESAFVPGMWSLEVTNILVVAERKQRISFAKITGFLRLLENLAIQVDSETNTRSFREILSLAHSEQLTYYDAAYLELAMRRGIPLATKDSQLSKAAIKLGVAILA